MFFSFWTTKIHWRLYSDNVQYFFWKNKIWSYICRNHKWLPSSSELVIWKNWKRYLKVSKNSKSKFWMFWVLQSCKISAQNSVYSRLQKKDKSDKILNFENVHCSSHSDLHICLFLLSLKYNEFRLEFFHTSRSYYYLHPEFLFRIFGNF
jgi:hypothetical protein